MELPEDGPVDGTVGVPYSHTITATGGTGALSYSATGLPANLSIDSSSGVISGTPAASSDFSVEVTATDEKAVSASRSYSLKVYTPIAIQTASLPDATAGTAYSQTLQASGGKGPLTWALVAGTLPPGLSLSAAGVLSGTITAGTRGTVTFTVSVTDAGGRTDSRQLTLEVRALLAIINTALTAATEGVTYLKAPGAPEQILASGGTPPYAFSAMPGLPPGIALDAAAGVLSGIPAQGAAGPYPVAFTVTDAASRTATATLNLQVRAPTPIYAGGTDGVAPTGSPITDVLTVFTVDHTFHPRGDMAVRLRKNGQEFSPVKQQITDPVTGKTVFTGLGLNGTTDTVDITVNGKDVVNHSWQKVNASLVTIPLSDFPVPGPRAYASGAIDPPSGKLIVTGGKTPDQFSGESPALTGIYWALNDILRLSDSAAGTWVEDLPPGLTASPKGRWGASMAYSPAAGVHVLFGGVDGSYSTTNGLWHYDASAKTWTAPTASGGGPSPRRQAAMAGLSSGQIVIFGGSSATWYPEPLGDLFVYDPATSVFSQRFPTAGPAARLNAASAAVGDQMWICGGADSLTELSDCWSYDPSSNAFTSRAPLPGGRQGSAMAATAAGQIYVFGGLTAGTTTNQLLLHSGGSWTVPTQTNPPPRREGAVLAVEPATGHLLLFGGRDETLRYFSDLWSYDPGTGAWTRRATAFSNPSGSGHTISGTISNAAVSSLSRVVIEASGLSGYVNRQIIATPGGTATYVLPEIPPGDTVTLTVLNENRNLQLPDREWSWIDLGAIATGISGNVTRNVVMPAGPMSGQLLTVSGSYVLPSGFLGTVFWSAAPRMVRPGHADQRNGTFQVNQTARTFRADHFPPSPGSSQMVVLDTASTIASACERTIVYLRNLSPGPQPPVALPHGPHSLAPGLTGCIPHGKGLQELGGISDGTMGLGGLAVADLSGDGMADVVMLNGDEVIIYRGQGSGEGTYLGSPQRLQVSGAPSSGLAVADVDGNGRLDIVAGSGDLGIAVWLQSTTGSFSALYWTYAGPGGEISVGDINGDGNQDILAVNGGGLGWLQGIGQGLFVAGNTVTCGGALAAASPLADLDGDGRADVACAGPTNEIRFLRGSAAGLQDTGISRPTPFPVRRIAVGDLDGDGRRDLAVTTQALPVLQTWRNLGNFQFSTAANVSLQGTPRDVQITELNGDALPDVVTEDDSGQLLEYAGAGGGALDPLPFFSQALGTNGRRMLAIGDLNTDGNPDVAVGDTTSQEVRLFAARRPIPAGTGPLSFVAPPNTRIYSIIHGPEDAGLDFEITSRGVGGTNTVDFPALSPLRPSRPAPTAGQTSWWTMGVYQSNDPATLGMENYRPENPRNVDAIGYYMDYVRYRR